MNQISTMDIEAHKTWNVKSFVRSIQIKLYKTGSLIFMDIIPGPATTNLKDQSQMTRFQAGLRHFKKDWQLTIMFIPCICFYLLFRYVPMYGLLMAFKRYSPYKGILGSKWVGLKYFEQFFNSPDFLLLFKNTLLLGLYTLLWTFPFPIIFAILLNELKREKFKRTVQTVSYLPSFLSVVIVSSMVIDFLSPNSGVINNILDVLGFDRVYFMIKPEWFRTVYITSDIWQSTGFGAIVYLAAITCISPSLYEAGKMDGCNRLQAMIHITLPGIFPTIATMFILKTGGIMRIGFEKVLLLYNPTTFSVADIFSTFVYRKGIVDMNYGFATAVGMFESVVSLIFVIAANTVSRKVSEQSLW